MGGRRTARQGHGAPSRCRTAMRVLVEWTLVLVVCLVMFPCLAYAAEAVPMCGELGQSIEAPPPLYPSKGDVLAPTPCDGQRRSTVSATDAEAPREVAPLPLVERQLGLLSTQLLPRVRSIRLSVPPATADERRPGFAPTVERPPRLLPRVA